MTILTTHNATATDGLVTITEAHLTTYRMQAGKPPADPWVVALWRSIAQMSPTAEDGSLQIQVEWTPLHQLWLSTAYPGFYAWLHDAHLVPCVSLELVDLLGHNFLGAHMRGASLRLVNFENACLRSADLREADLLGASLRGADLAYADLQGADLRGSSFRWACMMHANLRGADLRDASLLGADLRWADLSGANLEDANLRGASFEGINLKGANIKGADFGDYDPTAARFAG